MPVTLGVFGVGALALVAVAVLSRRPRDQSTGVDDVEPLEGEDIAVRAASKSHAIVGFVHRTSRNVAGSTMLTVGLVVVVLLAAFAGAMFDMVTSERGFAAFDSAVAEWGARAVTPASKMILTVITQLGSSLGAVIAIAATGYIQWRKRRTTGPAIFLAVVFGGHAVISNLVKFVVDRDRPFVEHLVDTVSSSFPSTHSGTAAAVWAGVALVAGTRQPPRTRFLLGIGALIVTAGVAASRALLGVHWLTDVLGGVAIGWAWFLLVAISFGGRTFRIGEPAERLARATDSGSDQP